MAQAARLCLRLQKELKLLLSDPPPGASFPRLSSAAAGSGDLSALTTVDAQIEGPEGTVYADGIFNLKVQIPDRYPFQPPIVTFATPIYHPNIDSGGRICLNILNLPPKGAWQPSLNISTVLTSIGLLLSEPNPDDGLMCEASKEYKYNRQAFDHKARTMTEKYAKVGVAGSGISNHSHNVLNMSKIHGVLKASESESIDLADSTKNSRIAAEDVPDQQHELTDSRAQNDSNGKRKAMVSVLEVDVLGSDRLQRSRRKLSLASSAQVQKKEECHKELSTQLPSRAEDSSTSSLPMHPSGSHANGFSTSCIGNKEPRTVFKKLSLGLKRPLVKQGGDISDKANVGSADNLLTSNAETFARNKNSGVEMEKASMTETIVVLDSDDSEEEEEETGTSRSILSLTRRRFGKQKLLLH